MKTRDLTSLITFAEKQFSERSEGKLTPTRKLVLSSLLKSRRALSAYELTDQIREDSGRTIPTMSVYRILDLLVSTRLVHKVSLANKYVICSHIRCSHKHTFARFLVCRNCNRVKESMEHSSTVKKLEKNIQDSGFQLLNNQLEISCLCNECAD